MEFMLGIWAILVGIVVFNGFAAGAVAALHVWRPRQARGSRALAGASMAGLVPIVVWAPAMFEETAIGTESVLGTIVGMAVVGGLTMAVSLPGALILSRKLDGPGETYRTFE